MGTGGPLQPLAAFAGGLSGLRAHRGAVPRTRPPSRESQQR
jgi:hypothetical protein